MIEPVEARMRRMVWSTLLLVAAVVMSLSAVTVAHAQGAWPSRPVRIVVPFTVGTGMDILARTMQPRLAARLGTPVVVENMPGASGNIGTEAVARSAPDGYTLLLTGDPFVTNLGMFKSVPYDPIKSFVPIGQIALGSLALVVHPKMPVKSLAELVAAAKATPGKINYGSPGNGTPHHLAMEMLKLHLGVDITHIPYKGTAGAVTDLLAGQIQVMFLPVHVALPHAEAGRLRMLTAGGAQRSPVTPAVLSLAEAGLRDVETDMWYALFAPAGTPAPVVARLSAEIGAILGLAEVRESLLKQGMTPAFTTAEKLAHHVQSELKRWTAAIRQAGIQPD
jgi:tripartite-type tricarboxylate transporter receptor subunit TctC